MSAAFKIEARILMDNINGGTDALEQTVEPLRSQFALLTAALPAGDSLSTACRLRRNIEQLITEFEVDNNLVQTHPQLMLTIHETLAPILEAAKEVMNAVAAEAAQPAQVEQPAQFAQPEQAIQPAQFAQPEQAAQPAQVEQPAQFAQPEQAIQPAQFAQPEQAAQPAQVEQPADRGKRSLQDIAGDPKRRRMDSGSSSGDKDDQKAQGLVLRIEKCGKRCTENMEKLIAEKGNYEREESELESSVVEAKDNFFIRLEVLIAVSNELLQKDAVMDQILKIKEIGDILKMMETFCDHAGGYKGEAEALMAKYGQDIQWIQALNINLKTTAYAIGGK